MAVKHGGMKGIGSDPLISAVQFGNAYFVAAWEFLLQQSFEQRPQFLFGHFVALLGKSVLLDKEDCGGEPPNANRSVPFVG